MGIINRRNAVLGWGVWKVAKKAGKRKARAAAGGALWFWRKKSDETTPGS